MVKQSSKRALQQKARRAVTYSQTCGYIQPEKRREERKDGYIPELILTVPILICDVPVPQTGWEALALQCES